MTSLVDAESVYEPPSEPGAPVDPPDRPATFASVIPRQHDRRPILPAALRNPEQRRTLARWSVGYAAHATAYHLTRSPKYATKVVFWAPVGLWRTVALIVRWGFDLEAAGTRQNAATMNNTPEYLALSRHRDKRVRWRGWVLTFASLAVLAAAVAVTVAPPWVWWVVLAAMLPPLAVMGRPADRPITDRVYTGPQYRKLTAELVRGMMLATGYGKEPEDFQFPREIHRDGPGYSALVDLPHGVTAAAVMDRRDRAAAKARLPLDQVWMRPGRHAGQVELWVADEPVSAARQKPWPLAKAGRVDLFKPFPMGTNERGEWVNVLLMFTNAIIGAIPRMGKTFVLRLFLLAAALDSRAKIAAADLKGTGDFGMLQPVCSAYFVGDDDDEMDRLMEFLRGLSSELRRRAKVIRDLPRDLCPESKVTPELAANRTLGLEPWVVGIDECQVLFTHDDHGKEAEKILTDLVKRGPAVGIIVLLATQRPDSKSLPTGISGNAGMRFCLRVMGQIENDLVLGTSMYKNGVRSTQFTAADKGLGWLVGAEDEPVVARSSYVDAVMAERIVARAVELRGGPVAQDAPRERVKAYNLLDDVRAVWVDGEDALWSELIVPRLAQLRPDVYGGWDVAAFGAAMRSAGVPTTSIHRKVEGRGVTRYGVRLDALNARLTAKPGRQAIEDGDA